MSYQRVNWQTGTKVSDGYVEIDGTRHPVTPPTYSGPTPCNPTSLNIMDVGIEENSNNIDKINNKLNGQASINELYVGGIKHKNFWVFPDEKIITTRESFLIDIPAGTYTISGEITGDDAIDSLIQFYDDNDDLVNSVSLEHNISTHQTFQLSSDCKIVRVYSNDSYESSLNKIAVFENMQLEPGDTVTDYSERKNIIPIIENSLDSDSTTNAPSVHAVKEKVPENLTTDGNAVKTGRKIDGKTEYVKRYSFKRTESSAQVISKNLGFVLDDVIITKIDGTTISNSSNWFNANLGDYLQNTGFANKIQLFNSSNTVEVEINANFDTVFVEIWYISKD